MRVVIIEPSEPIRSRLVMRLYEAGLEVVADVGTCEAAVSQLATCRADAILMELQLPDMEPLETVRAVRTHAPKARIVVLTNATYYRQRSLASGADHFLDKSTEFDDAAALLVGCR